MIAALLVCPLFVVDGDTLRCGRERIRLLGIDAPELPGHCRRGRRCVPGNPWRSRDSLAAVIRGKAKIERVGEDRYGRTLALVRVNGVDLSCHQLVTGNAAYKPQWDNDGDLAGICAAAR
jgi:micrococcal nuclease